MNALSHILSFNFRSHRPCFYLALCFASGIMAGYYLPPCWAWLSVATGVLLILSLGKLSWSRVSLLLAWLGLGAFYLQLAFLFPADHVAFLAYQDRKDIIAIEGLIDSQITVKSTLKGDKKVFELVIKEIQLKDRKSRASGRVLVEDYAMMSLNYGDHVWIEGRMHKAFSSKDQRFSYQQYLEHNGIYYLFHVSQRSGFKIMSQGHGQAWMRMVIRSREKISRTLQRYLNPREVGMIQAMVIGDRSKMPQDIYELFSRTGTAHVVAISGMNIAIISAILLFIFKALRFSRMWQFVLTMIFLMIYAFLSGFSPSVVRSVLMATVVLASFCLEGQTDTLNSLGLACMILLLIDPLNLWDWGFQLSFLSVGVIILAYPLIKPLLEHIDQKIISYLIQAIFISVIAWIGVGMLGAYYFGILSPIGILANLCIVPLADAVVALGLGVALLGIFCDPLAVILAASLKAAYNLMVLIAFYMAQAPKGYFYVSKLSIAHVFCYYFFLIIVYLFIKYKISKQKESG